MLSALILTEHSYSTLQQVATIDTPEVRSSRSSRTRDKSPQESYVHAGYKPNCLTTFWTQLAYHFNRRTAEPLEGAPPPGCDEPTSRCQTAPSMWTIGRDKPVIPRVTFIRVRCRSHIQWTMFLQRVTCSVFPLWSNCNSRSQAGLCACTITSISIRS